MALWEFGAVSAVVTVSVVSTEGDSAVAMEGLATEAGVTASAPD